MTNNYVLLIEKEEMWARMLMDVLKDNGVPCEAIPVYGAALVLKAGAQERLRVYVPREKLDEANEWLDALFSAPIVEEE